MTNNTNENANDSYYHAKRPVLARGLAPSAIMIRSLAAWPALVGPGERRACATPGLGLAGSVYFHPMLTILRRMNAICVASGRSLGQTSWQASSDMQPNTPSSSPITS